MRAIANLLYAQAGKFAITIGCLLVLSSAIADGNHGGAAPKKAAEVAAPKFSAESELFEIVATLKGKSIRLTLDHWADNAPVVGATVEIDVKGTKLIMKPAEKQGEYEAELAAEQPEGVYPVVITVKTKSDVDLLTGEFDVHSADNPAEKHQDSWHFFEFNKSTLIGTAAGSLVLAFLLFRIFRRNKGRN